jgi:iron(III) transport system substrate-binding protein
MHHQAPVRARASLLSLAGGLLTALAGVGLASCSDTADLRVYVALDQEHSESLIDRFAEETGLAVDPRFDTEASKTVGLVSALIEEKDRPRCDVFWNNEIAQTVRLAQQGITAPYTSPSAASIPSRFKDPNGHWTGFAARARVLIVNTDLVPEGERPSSMWDLIDPKWKGKCGIAVPVTGTTLTHFAALNILLGDAEFERFVEGLFANDVQLLQSNGATMKAVRDGNLHFAFTDTDDYHVAKSKGFPVTCVFPDQGEGQVGTMLIPNSVAVIADAPHGEAAHRFVDWVLREQTEALLAAAKSAQIPVRSGVEGPADDAILPVGSFREMAWDVSATAASLAEKTDAFAKRFDRR